MKYQKQISAHDLEIAKRNLHDFIPDEIFDIHVHPYNPIHFPAGEWEFLNGIGVLGCKEHTNALAQYMPFKTMHGLYFGMPRLTADRESMNAWVREEVTSNGTEFSAALMVVSPMDDPKLIAEELSSKRFCGIKVYHCYAGRKDTMNADLTEYAPEWMWELLNEHDGVMLLHMVRDGAIADMSNQREIIRLCRSYPRVKLILAHVARSFNYRNALDGLESMSDIDNVVVDTSAICETESFRAAIKYLGPKRILWGSDFAISELKGRCVTTGDHFFWLHPELIEKKYTPPTSSEMTLVGIESLMTLKEACEESGLVEDDVQDIFLNNAMRLLRPHLPIKEEKKGEIGPKLWVRARKVISGGTGLLSKRAEMFDPEQWPSYFSRAKGCEVWDLEGRRFVDFGGGIGAVLLGYGDDDVNKAVQRRIILGTYSSLVNPQEVELAEKLLALHPWAGKVRFARGGGDAMAVAVRIARASSGKSGVAFCGYHGWHDWYLAANLGAETALDGHLLPGLVPLGVPRELKGTAVPFKYNDFASFEKALEQLGDKLGVVVMEPMRSHEPTNEFVHKVAERARAAGAVFVVDEITSGLRIGFPGALSRLGVEPDIAVYAKAMGNGFPFATVVGRERIMNQADDSFISSSYWTDGVGTAAALAVLEKMERLNIQEEVWNKGMHLRKELNRIAVQRPNCKITIAGMPTSLSLAFDLGDDASLAKTIYVRKMQERGILVSTYIYLMYAHEEKHIQTFIQAFELVTGELEHLIEGGLLSTALNTAVSHSGFSRLV